LEENSRIDVISTGGTLQRKWSALAGPITLGSLSGMNFDQIYVSCGGLSIERGVMTSFAFIADILRRVSKVTRDINLLADSSKFSKVGTFSIMPVTQMTRVITDKKLENHVAKSYRDIGLELIV
jgi:DeoR/GlpR family transcriptional regulator of sugar metabolism